MGKTFEGKNIIKIFLVKKYYKKFVWSNWGNTGITDLEGGVP